MLQLTKPLPPRWQNALLGALLGDALGVPHEFKRGHELPARNKIQMVMPDTYPKSHGGVPYGTWSDDGSQLLALLDTLDQGRGAYCEETFVKNLLAWLRDAKYQAGGVVFDCGLQTHKALAARAAGEVLSVPEGPICGNGSLMRVLPAAMLPEWQGVAPAAALEVALAQSSTTHPQVLAGVLCALYVELCWHVPEGPEDSWRAAVTQAASALALRGVLNGAELDTLPRILDYGANVMPTGSGYVLDTFWAAVWAVEHATSLSDALRRAVGLGNDTDTVACVTGGLAGLVFGLDEVSLEWQRHLSA